MDEQLCELKMVPEGDSIHGRVAAAACSNFEGAARGGVRAVKFQSKGMTFGGTTKLHIRITLKNKVEIGVEAVCRLATSGCVMWEGGVAGDSDSNKVWLVTATPNRCGW